MDRDLARELEISLRLLKKVVDASENPDNVQEQYCLCTGRNGSKKLHRNK